MVYEPFSQLKLGFTYCEILCSLPCSVLDEFQVNCDQASTVGDHVLCPVYFPHQAVQDADIIVSSQLYFVNAKFRLHMSKECKKHLSKSGCIKGLVIFHYAHFTSLVQDADIIVSSQL